VSLIEILICTSFILFILLVVSSIIYMHKRKTFNHTKKMLNDALILQETFIIQIKEKDLIIKGLEDKIFINNTDEKEEIAKMLNLIYSQYSRIMTVNKLISGDIDVFIKWVTQASLKAITNYTSIIDGLEQTLLPSFEIMQEIKTKLTSSFSSENNHNNYNSEYIKNGYEKIIFDILQELSIIISRKTADIKRLDDINIKIENTVSFSNDILELSEIVKILAINAKIESCRAGMAGKGFQVVSTEVEKLSLKSSNLAKIIKESLKTTNLFMDKTLGQLKETAISESDFLNSKVVTLLNEIFISIIYSFVKMSDVTDNIMKSTASLKKDVQNIIYEMQFEDQSKLLSIRTNSILFELDKDMQIITNQIEELFKKNNIPIPHLISNKAPCRCLKNNEQCTCTFDKSVCKCLTGNKPAQEEIDIDKKVNPDKLEVTFF